MKECIAYVFVCLHLHAYSEMVLCECVSRGLLSCSNIVHVVRAASETLSIRPCCANSRCMRGEERGTKAYPRKTTDNSTVTNRRTTPNCETTILQSSVVILSHTQLPTIPGPSYSCVVCSGMSRSCAIMLSYLYLKVGYGDEQRADALSTNARVRTLVELGTNNVDLGYNKQELVATFSLH